MNALPRRQFLGSIAGAALGSCLPLALRAAKKTAAGADESGLRDPAPDRCGPYRLGSEIYRNPLRSESDVAGFRLEGEALASFPSGRLRLENKLAASLKQKSNFVYWFDRALPADFAAAWDFRPVREPGLCMVFFAAQGRRGQDLFDPALAPRTGEYPQYHHGDIDAFHLSYFRRGKPGERGFHVCNLRKSYGFNLVAEGADPLPSVADSVPPYRIELIKCGSAVAFYINRLPVLEWIDDGARYGPKLGAGRIGFRQMAPLQAEYENFVVHEVTRA
jgi:hypothetical protein